jgi:acyl-CoA synthetase (AMP-forming)/AMP-acid ligase II
MMGVGDIVRLNARQRGQNEALVLEDERLTYADLNSLVNKVAGALTARGVRVGDRVGSLSRNQVELVALYFATAKIGALLVPMSYWYRAEELQHVAADSGPVLMFHAPEYAGRLAEVPALAGVPAIAMDGLDRSGEWASFVATGADVEPQVELTGQSPHMVIYTSGTTGRPKGAVLAQGRTVEGAMMMDAAHRLRETDTYLNYFPPFHSGNWDNQLMFLLLGAKVVLLRQFDAGQSIDAIQDERVTVLNALATMMDRILNAPGFATCDKSSVRLIYYAAFDPGGVMRRVAEQFGFFEGRVDMMHTYGLTEGCPFVTSCPGEFLMEKWGSIGRPIPGAEVELLDDEGTPVPDGEAGELCVRLGPHFSYYLNQPEETAQALAGGWFHTGDVARRDEDGFLWLVDRKKDMIRSGGHNVFSKQVEECLLLHEDVADAAVIGVPDPVYEESVLAVVVRRGGSAEPQDDLAARLTEHVRASLAGYNVPKHVEFVHELPRNAVGKVTKHVLRDQLAGRFARSPDGPV